MVPEWCLSRNKATIAITAQAVSLADKMVSGFELLRGIPM